MDSGEYDHFPHVKNKLSFPLLYSRVIKIVQVFHNMQKRRTSDEWEHVSWPYCTSETVWGTFLYYLMILLRSNFHTHTELWLKIEFNVNSENFKLATLLPISIWTPQNKMDEIFFFLIAIWLMIFLVLFFKQTCLHLENPLQ